MGSGCGGSLSDNAGFAGLSGLIGFSGFSGLRMDAAPLSGSALEADDAPVQPPREGR